MTAPADLAEVRAALDLAAKATPGPMTVGRFAHDNDLDSAAAIHVATGETIATFDNADRTDEASPVREAIAMIALHNAAPAIAAAVEELERLRAHVARYQVAAVAVATEIGGPLGPVDDDPEERAAAFVRFAEGLPGRVRERVEALEADLGRALHRERRADDESEERLRGMAELLIKEANNE